MELSSAALAAQRQQIVACVRAGLGVKRFRDGKLRAAAACVLLVSDLHRARECAVAQFALLRRLA